MAAAAVSTQTGAVAAAAAAVVTAVAAADGAIDGNKKRKAASYLVKANVASTKKPPCATSKSPTPTEVVCFIVVFIHMNSYTLKIL